MKITNILPVITIACLTACSTTPNQSAATAFHGAAQADLIIQYNTDATTLMIKPLKMEGAFRSILPFQETIEAAKALPGKDMAVVQICHFTEDHRAQELQTINHVKDSLQTLGYKHIVFVRGTDWKVDGQEIRAQF